MEIQFKLIKSTHQKSPFGSKGLRGFLLESPQLGEPLIILTLQSTASKKRSRIITSKVLDIKDMGDFVLIKTENSLYEIKFLSQSSTLRCQHFDINPSLELYNQADLSSEIFISSKESFNSRRDTISLSRDKQLQLVVLAFVLIIFLLEIRHLI